MKNNGLMAKVRSIDFKSYLRDYALILVLIGMLLILSILTPNFLTGNNILNIFRQIATNGILAIGMTFVIVLGGIDISVGSLCAVAGVVSAMVLEANPHMLLAAILAGIASTSLLGAVVGIMVSKFNVAPFIATLSMLTIARGLALVISGGVPITITNDFFNAIGNGNIGGEIPISVVLFMVIAILAAIILWGCCKTPRKINFAQK